MENSNRQVLLKRRPTGAPRADDFELADAPIPDPAEGEVLVRGIYLSLDPYMRGRMSAARSYARPVDVGAVMEGRVVGRIVRSRDPGFREGDYVLGGYGWQLYSAVPASGLSKLDPNEAPLSTALGVLGMPGLTAYVGLSEIGRPQRGETVVVSAASPVAGTNAVMSRANSGLTLASTIARPIWAPRSTAPARAASMSTGKMSAARCNRRHFRGSMISAAW
jgi:NADPH-dependent curcumin reductase